MERKRKKDEYYVRCRCRSFCIVFLPSMQESESESSLHRNISSASAHSLVLTALSVGLQPRCEGHAVFTAAELSFLSAESMSWTTNSLRVVLCSNTSHSFLRPTHPFENKPFECLSFSFFQIVILVFFICILKKKKKFSFSAFVIYLHNQLFSAILCWQFRAGHHLPPRRRRLHSYARFPWKPSSNTCLCYCMMCTRQNMGHMFFFLPHLQCTFWPTFKPSLGSYRLSSKSLDIRCHASLLHWCNAGVD